MLQLRLRSLRHVRAAPLAFGILLVFFTGVVQAAQQAIASAHPLATKAGEDILADGGNAFDAAVAVAAALGVVEPFASGLGGGGFFLLRRAQDDRRMMVDAREVAPGAASSRMFLDDAGKENSRLSIDGALAAGIPGTPAGIAWLARKYGKLPLARSLAPAIRLAREGYEADSRYLSAAGFRAGVLKSDARAAAVFLDNGEAPKAGFKVRQPALAATLETLAAKGHDGFYRGELAQRMVDGVKAAGGIWEMDDLARYEVIERVPQTFTYRGATLTCASLPSSGGLVLAQTLQILERFALRGMEQAARDHLVVEAWRRAYQDRARYMGDPAFAQAPSDLGTRDYADVRAASIRPDAATPSSALDERYPPVRQGDNTTHFSIVDANGNWVAATLSVNLPFGAGTMAGDTGVLLNDEMNDFSIAPASGNAYGLVGGTANAVAPGKRPLSSMTPTFVEDARGTLVLGTPGGSRIISMVTLGVLDYVDDPALDIDRLVGLPRFHHQYLPDRIEFEPGAFSSQWVSALQAKGHTVQEGRRRWGNMQAVFVRKDTREASAHSDPRGKAGVLF